MEIHKHWCLVFIMTLILPFSPVRAALPVEVQADQFALAAKQSYREGDYLEAEKSFVKLMMLGVEMPANVYYFYAKTLFENRKYTAAKQSVETYIEKSGREGKHYRDALTLLVELEKLPDYAEGPDYDTTVDWLVEAVNDNCEVHLRSFWKQTCDLSIDRGTFSLSVRREGLVFDQDTLALILWPVKTDHHQMQIYRQCVHHDHFMWFCTDQFSHWPTQ